MSKPQWQLRSDLIKFAEEGNEAEVKSLIDSGVEVDHANGYR